MKLVTLLTVGLALAMPLPLPSQATAQSVRIGNTDDAIDRFLSARGYSDIQVQSRTFTIARAHACKNGEKFLVKVDLLGRVRSATRIGDCGPAFTAAQAVRRLQSDGYRDIDARPEGNRVVAIACLDNRKFALTFARDGRLIDRKRRGRCRPDALSDEQVVEVLRDQGLNRIEMVDGELPRYVARACDGIDRIELVLNRRGQVRSDRTIGRCKPAIDPAQLAETLDGLGYKRIRIINDKKAPYLARACSEGKRYELIVSRWGDVRSQTALGNCRSRINESQLLQLIADEGYKRLSHRRGDNGRWLVDACRGEDRATLVFSRFGVLRRVSDTGSCKSQTVLEVAEELERRGARNVEVILEGCWRDKRYRWSFDRLGNRVGRQPAEGTC